MQWQPFILIFIHKTTIYKLFIQLNTSISKSSSHAQQEECREDELAYSVSGNL